MLEGLLRRIKYGKPIIVVSGLPRSGTSMLMKMLEAAGVEIASDGLRTADEDNPKGYYELERVKELDKGEDKSWLKELRGKAVKIISLLLKELPDENNYKVIFVNRDLKEVMASQNKMLIHRGESVNSDDDEKMISRYEKHLQKVQSMLEKEPRFEVLFINHRDILTNPVDASRKINQFLGGHLDEDKLAVVVDSALYRNRAALLERPVSSNSE